MQESPKGVLCKQGLTLIILLFYRGLSLKSLQQRRHDESTLVSWLHPRSFRASGARYALSIFLADSFYFSY